MEILVSTSNLNKSVQMQIRRAKSAVFKLQLNLHFFLLTSFNAPRENSYNYSCNYYKVSLRLMAKYLLSFKIFNHPLKHRIL